MKYYIKISWNCGYAGTEGYKIKEFDEKPSEEKLSELAIQYHQENCGESWYEEATREEYENQY